MGSVADKLAEDSGYELVLPDEQPKFAPTGTIPGSTEYDIVTPDGKHEVVPSAQQHELISKVQRKLAGMKLLRKLLENAKNQRLNDAHVAKKTKKRRAKNKLAKASRKKNRR